MSPHPIRFQVPAAPGRERIQIAVRLVLLVALAAIGCSSVYWLAYLATPAVVALFVLQEGSQRYLSERAPVLVRALRWLAGAYAYLWLLTDALPGASDHPVSFEVELGGNPSASSALGRLILSLPAVVVWMVLSFAAGLLWFAAALCVLASERVPAALSDFIEATLRYQFRLVAYHLSLVDRYPSFEMPSAAYSAPGGMTSSR
jgi:hypothetical protein